MINKVILIGNVGADPEVRALEGGVKVARLRIATTERIYNRQTQETKEHTEWHNVTLWRNLADVADRFIRKGSQVYIEGSLRTRDWTDKDGRPPIPAEAVTGRKAGRTWNAGNGIRSEMMRRQRKPQGVAAYGLVNKSIKR